MEIKLNRQSTQVLTIAGNAVSQLDLNKTFALVLKKSMDIAKTKAGVIALYNPGDRSMRVHAHKGFSKDFTAGHKWTVRRGGLTERILQSNAAIVMDGSACKSFFSKPGLNEGIKSLVCIPLMLEQEVVGILCLADFVKRTFSGSVTSTLEIVGSFASIAIHHAIMHDNVRQMAITDTLTGLFNRRCFENVLSRELDRAGRHPREFSLALVDVDDFKKFNDAFGHPAGDEALAFLGQAIRQSIRSTDFAARYGGDEIVIILPDTRLSKACALFKGRIRRGIEDRFSKLSKGRHALTVTIGIASYPGNGKNAQELIRAADQALLAAKKEKHNRRIGCAPLVPGTLQVTPSPLRTVPGAGWGLP